MSNRPHETPHRDDRNEKSTSRERVLSGGSVQIWAPILIGDSRTDDWLLDAALLSLNDDDTIH